MNVLNTAVVAFALATLSWGDDVTNRDIKLQSHQVKQGRKEDVKHHINASMTVKKPYSDRSRIKGQLIVIYKLPVKGGVYTYTKTDMRIVYKPDSYKWAGTYDMPHRKNVKIKYDGDTAMADASIEYYDYMLLIYTDEAEPKVFCSKSSWVPLYKKLLELGTEKNFDSKAAKVDKLERSLAMQNLRGN